MVSRIVPKLAHHLDQLMVRDALFRVGYFYGAVTPADLDAVDARATDAGVDAWHRALADASGVGAAYSFAAGRMGLYAILKALEIQPGDEVIIPAFTCVAVPNAIQFAGATPVYADVDPDTFNVSVADVKRKITPRTRVVMAQHTFGNPADLAGLREIADADPKLALVEDACLAIGAAYDGRPIGSWGDAAFVSTDATKMICTDIGGAALTRDPGLADRIAAVWEATPEMPADIERRIVRQFKARYRATRPEVYWRIFVNRFFWGAPLPTGFASSDEEDGCVPTAYPFPARFLRPMVPVAMRQLADIEANVAHRTWVAGRLDALFAGRSTMRVDPRATCSWMRYPLLVDEPAKWVNVFDKYVKIGDWFDSPAYGWRHDMAQVGYAEGSCPVAESMHRRIINFPTHYLMDERALRKIEQLWDRHHPELR
jgi:dTDP-4-amino-4,6-dideoxygalactose transaminase